jgi:deoxycytidylate deaminase
MTCAKAHIDARIVLPDGTTYRGANTCNRPQPVCPRIAAGHGRDDYRLCSSECWQWGHAEMAALAAAARARADLTGAWCYVTHWRVCGACRAALNARGIPDERIVCEGVRPAPIDARETVG